MKSVADQVKWDIWDDVNDQVWDLVKHPGCIKVWEWVEGEISDRTEEQIMDKLLDQVKKELNQ